MSETIRGSSGNILDIDYAGGIVPTRANSATITSSSVSTTSQTLLAANALRKGLLISNMAATAVLFVKFGATAVSATSHTVRIPAYGYYEMPLPIYTGIVDGIWDVTTGGGSALVTELV